MELFIFYMLILTPFLLVAGPLFVFSAYIARSSAEISKKFAIISLYCCVPLMAIYVYAGYAMSLETSVEEAIHAMMPFFGMQLMIFGIALVLISRSNDMQKEEGENDG